MKVFKWTKEPIGYCPVQGEGYFIGHNFYFRSRYNEATIEFYKRNNNNVSKLIKHYLLYTTNTRYGAGYLAHWKCKLLIYKGCLKFLFKFKSSF